MRRLLTLTLSLLLLCSVLLFSSPRLQAQDTSNFSFDSFEADYYLSRNSKNRSTLRVVEKLVARFPDYNQNHGIERAIPTSYDSHDAGLKIESVKNDRGSAWSYSTYGSGGNEVLRIGDADKYVQGVQTYVITYTLQDVTKNFNDHDELFWDTNGTEWQQPFGSVTARLHIPAGLASKLQDREPRCFTGTAGSKARNCAVTTTNTTTETIMTATTTNRLAAAENLSFVVGFEPGTFAKYVAPPTNPIVYVLIAIASVWYVFVPVIVTTYAVRTWRHFGRDPKGKGTIIPEYTPPKEAGVLVSSVVLQDRMQPKAISAQLIGFAVRGYVKLYETDKKKYDIELVRNDTQSLKPEEAAVLHLWFPQGAKPGERKEVGGEKLYTKVQDISTQTHERALELGYMQDVRKHQKKLNIWGGVLLALSLFTLNILGVLAAIVILILAYQMPARTEAGVSLRDYLYGLKLYMQVAEADRIKQLQAPGTAEKIDVNDKAQLVKLYEQLLPYAMLFGIEKQWASQFANLYTQPPQWYSGNYSTFNAAVFTGSLASLSSNTTSSFSPPSSSSSSGFSGGGSSGGGGGGGGGGW